MILLCLLYDLIVLVFGVSGVFVVVFGIGFGL